MPFCPECRKSYETGVILCRDCQSHLVEELPKVGRSKARLSFSP